MKTGIVVMVLFIGVFGFGYISNIYNLFHCDFKSPYKSEAIRSAGVFIPPLGAVAGYIELKDE